MAEQKARIVISAADQTRAAFASVERNVSSMESALGSAMGKFGSLGALVTAAIGGHTLAGTVDMLDTLDDISQKTGITAASLSELRYAAEVAGTPFEALTVGIRKLSVNATEAAGGNKEMAATFKALGVEVRDSSGKMRSTESILTDVIGAFGGYQAGAEKTALAVKVFGKSGEDLIPILDQGKSGLSALRKEAQALGVVYTDELAKASGDFNDNLARLKLVAEAASAGLLGSLVPALVEMTQQLLEGRKAYGSFVGALVDLGTLNPMKSTQENIRSTVDEIRGLNAEIEKIQERIAAGNARPASRFGRGDKAELDRLQQEIATAEARFKYLQAQAGRDAGSVGGGRGITDPTAKPKGSAPVVNTTTTTKEAASEYDRLIQRLRARMEVEKEEQRLGRDLTSSERERMAALGELRAILEKDPTANGKRARAMIEEIFASAQLNETEKERVKAQKALGEERNRESMARAEELARMSEQTLQLADQLEEFGLTERQLRSLRLARLEHALSIEEERLATLSLLDAGGPAAEAQREKIRLLEEQLTLQKALAASQDTLSFSADAGALAALREYSDEVSRVGDRTRDATTGMLHGFEEQLTDSLATGKAKWGDYVAYVLRELVRLTTVQPAMNTFSRLLIGFAGAGGGGGGTGGYSGNGTQAMGTSLAELGLSSGTRSVTSGAKPVAMLASANTGSAVTIDKQVNHYGSNVSKAEVLEAQRQGNAELEYKILRSRRTGGPL